MCTKRAEHDCGAILATNEPEFLNCRAVVLYVDTLTIERQSHAIAIHTASRKRGPRRNQPSLAVGDDSTRMRKPSANRSLVARVYRPHIRRCARETSAKLVLSHTTGATIAGS